MKDINVFVGPSEMQGEWRRISTTLFSMRLPGRNSVQGAAAWELEPCPTDSLSRDCCRGHRKPASMRTRQNHGFRAQILQKAPGLTRFPTENLGYLSLLPFSCQSVLPKLQESDTGTRQKISQWEEMTRKQGTGNLTFFRGGKGLDHR